MKIKSFKDMCGCEYTALFCSDSLNLSVNGKILSISKEQFREISEIADKWWSGEKTEDYKRYVKYL